MNGGTHAPMNIPGAPPPPAAAHAMDTSPDGGALAGRQQPPPQDPTATALAQPADDGAAAGEVERPKADALLIPKAAIKRIMKLDPEVNQVANDAVILVAKATEMFLEKFANEARLCAEARASPTVKYQDLSDACHADANYEFLTTVLPKPRIAAQQPPPPPNALAAYAPHAPHAPPGTHAPQPHIAAGHPPPLVANGAPPLISTQHAPPPHPGHLAAMQMP